MCGITALEMLIISYSLDHIYKTLRSLLIQALSIAAYSCNAKGEAVWYKKRIRSFLFLWAASYAGRTTWVFVITLYVWMYFMDVCMDGSIHGGCSSTKKVSLRYTAMTDFYET